MSQLFSMLSKEEALGTAYILVCMSVNMPMHLVKYMYEYISVISCFSRWCSYSMVVKPAHLWMPLCWVDGWLVCNICVRTGSGRGSSLESCDPASLPQGQLGQWVYFNAADSAVTLVFRTKTVLYWMFHVSSDFLLFLLLFVLFCSFVLLQTMPAHLAENISRWCKNKQVCVSNITRISVRFIKMFPVNVIVPQCSQWNVAGTLST